MISLFCGTFGLQSFELLPELRILELFCKIIIELRTRFSPLQS